MMTSPSQTVYNESPSGKLQIVLAAISTNASIAAGTGGQIVFNKLFHLCHAAKHVPPMPQVVG